MAKTPKEVVEMICSLAREHGLGVESITLKEAMPGGVATYQFDAEIYVSRNVEGRVDMHQGPMKGE